MSTLPKSRLRIAGDLFRFDRLTDLLRPSHTNQFEEEVPLLPRFHGADSLQVEIAIFNNGVLIHDLSAIASLELVIKPLSAADSTADTSASPNPDAQRGPASNVLPIVCKRIGNEHFNPAMTDAQWQSKAAHMAHAIITLDSEEAALSPGERWLSLIALGYNGQARTLAAGPILILGGGATFNALPQPIVKDLRDQAAISAAQAQQSANNAAASAQGAQNAAFAAQEQVTLAALAATQAAASAAQANSAVTVAQGASAQSAEARDAAQQQAAQAQDSARLAQQTASGIGDLATALAQASAGAARSEAAAATAEDERWAAASYAAMLNPQTKLAAGGIYKESAGSITLEQPVTLGVADFDLFVVASNVPRAQTEQDALLATPTDDRALVSYSPASGTWHVRDDAGTVRLTTIRSIPSETLIRLTRAGDTLSLTIDGELIAQTADIAAVDFGQFRFVGCRNAAGTGFGWQGTLRNFSVFNRVLDAPEAATVTGSGGQIIPPTARYGRADPLYVSDFNGGIDGWSANSQAALSVADGAVTIEATGAGNSVYIDRVLAEPVRVGQNYHMTFDVFIPSSNASAVSGLSIRPTNAAFPRNELSTPLRDQWVTLSTSYIYNSSSGNSPGLRIHAAVPMAVGDILRLRNIRYERVGCVLDMPLADGAGYQARDGSPNGNPALLSASGCTHFVPRRHFDFVWTRVSSGFLGDADRPVLPEGAVIESIIWEDAKATRTTASLGYNAANTATHVASFTPGQARQRATLAATSLPAADRRLYLNMSAAAGAVTLRVRGVIL